MGAAVQPSLCALNASLHLLLVQNVVSAVAALGGGAVGVGAIVSEDGALAAAGGAAEHEDQGQPVLRVESTVGLTMRVQRGRRKGLCTRASAIHGLQECRLQPQPAGARHRHRHLPLPWQRPSATRPPLHSLLFLGRCALLALAAAVNHAADAGVLAHLPNIGGWGDSASGSDGVSNVRNTAIHLVCDKRRCRQATRTGQLSTEHEGTSSP